MPARNQFSMTGSSGARPASGNQCAPAMLSLRVSAGVEELRI
jgi:hypothetical protein